MALSPEQLPGARFIERLLDRQARRAAKRDFLLRTMPRDGECAEIGVFDGVFSERILAITAPRRLHLVDPWTTTQDGGFYDGEYRGVSKGEAAQRVLQDQFQLVQQRLADDLAAGIVQVHRKLSFEAAPTFADDSLDWAYVDASHFYDDVRRDLADWLPKVKRRGFLCGDDYGRKSFWDNGVTRAVDELVASGAVELVRLHNHQYILRRR